MNTLTQKAAQKQAPLRLEEELFGPRWREATCSTDQAQAYFTRRFGFVSRQAFYDILGEKLKRVPLAPANQGHKTVGYVLFVSHLVAVCNEIEEQARRRIRTEPDGTQGGVSPA